jgi:hypothetical protein
MKVVGPLGMIAIVAEVVASERGDRHVLESILGAGGADAAEDCE